MALRLYNRIELFRSLKVMSEMPLWRGEGEEEGRRALERLSSTYSMPHWWRPYLYDRVIIWGIVQFGFDLRGSEEFKKYLEEKVRGFDDILGK